MLELAVILLVPAGIAIPHLLPLHRIAPRVAATIWLAALALRALAAIGFVLFIFLYVPQTGLFYALAHDCWHDVLPLLSTHLGLSGHGLAHAATVLPGLALAASVTWFGFGVLRGALALGSYLRQRTLADGPLDSVLVADDRVLLALTRHGRPRVLVSRAALSELDPEELQAGVSHELGHLRRHHRPLLLAGSVFTALGRCLPGTRAAERELTFNLERDADEYALHQAHDPLTLASAICKTASPVPAGLAPLAGRGRTTVRLDYLLEG
ncbi:MAG: M56 family metallopeptidase, partial [Thermoleophilaceae bacterium]|nr:M56 family metallopeptidase [Thermoleophilaceae bacterium]